MNIHPILLRNTRAVELVPHFYRGSDKPLARPGMKQANVSVRTAWISFGALPCREKKLDDSSRLDVVEMCDIVQGC